jgi:hypothetical protein
MISFPTSDVLFGREPRIAVNEFATVAVFARTEPQATETPLTLREIRACRAGSALITSSATGRKTRHRGAGLHVDADMQKSIFALTE